MTTTLYSMKDLRFVQFRTSFKLNLFKAFCLNYWKNITNQFIEEKRMQSF